MTDYVLVHGGNMSTDGWNKLAGHDDYPPGGRLGGRIWDSIIPALKARGHRVFAPTLQDENTCGLTGHIEQIGALIAGNHLQEILLAGHSYGGMIITGVADRIPERIRRLVYIDAALPDPGQSLFDLILSGGRDPLSFAGLEPARAYVEKLQFDPERLKPLPKTYIFCTASEFAPVTGLAREKISADPEGWTYLELPSSHVPMASRPEKLAKILLEDRP